MSQIIASPAIGANAPATGLYNTLPSIAPYRAVLFGDSMTSQAYVDTAATSASYNRATSVLTITDSAHGLASGWTVDVFNRSYSSLKKFVSLPITRIDANSYSVNLGIYGGSLPEGTLSGTTYARVPVRWAANGWFNWLQIASGYKFNLVFNGAQSGDVTADCIARINSHCLDYSPDVVFMQIPGINDMSTSSGPVAEETIWTNQKTIIDTILGTGAVLVVLTLTPVLTSEARATLQNMARVQRLNKRLQAYAQGKKSLIVIDSWKLVIDSSDTTGLALAAYLKNLVGDYIHYNTQGARRVGEAVWTAISGAFPGQYDNAPKSAIDCFLSSSVSLTSVSRSNNVITATGTAHGFLTGEYVKLAGGTSEVLNEWGTVTRVDANTVTFPSVGPNGSITGTIRMSRSNTISQNPVLVTATGGTIANGVTGTSAGNVTSTNHAGNTGTQTAVASVVAHPSSYGNVQRLVVSAAALNDLPGFQQTTTSLLNNEIKAGREYYFQCYLKIASANWTNTAASEIKVRLIANVDGVLYSVFNLDTYAGLPAAGSLTSDFEGVVRTANMLLPGGTVSQFYWQVYVRAAGSWTSNVTIDVGQIGIVEVVGA